MAFAHSANTDGQRQELEIHLRKVAALTEGFAQALGCAEVGRSVGLWHDLGKYDPAFQSYLREAEEGKRSRGPDHKKAGSLLASQAAGPLALLIQGHHGGLQSLTDLKAWLSTAGGVEDESLRLAEDEIPDLRPGSPLPLPEHLDDSQRAAETFLRLLYSCLVDADFLDTEAHFRAKSGEVRGATGDMRHLLARLERSQAGLPTAGAVNEVRREVYQASRAAADLPPGLFRLTVPTGGGKTRSAMAFALAHAVRHGLERIIVAIPFLSITEQTADVYRGIFEEEGREPVILEHHSGSGIDGEEGDDATLGSMWRSLSSENWDARIVVTTTVQLFESLFAAKPSRARKLHRLARSVIILDEAQSLPAHLLQPCLDVLRELTLHYGTTVVFTTATQPAFEAIPGFHDLGAQEIAPDPPRLFRRLARVRYERLPGQTTWEELAEALRGEEQVLVVLNTKKDTLALLDALDDPEALHLSTLLCGAHRRAVLAEVRTRLEQGHPCRLISTQVVEAGVDIDFPCVYRAAGPLDSIIQAAGRCNREGAAAEGRVTVFDPADGGLPPGAYRTGTQLTQALLTGGLDLGDPAAPALYYRRLFETVSTDREGIQNLRERFEFPEVAARFRMIDEDTESVVVTGYGTREEKEQVRALLDELRTESSRARHLMRRLQPYLVSIDRRTAARYLGLGLLSNAVPGLSEWLGGYDPVRGLTVDDPAPLIL